MGYADIVTTNMLLNHGLGELNPFMQFAQSWLGRSWVIPKLAATFFVMWLLIRAKSLRQGVLVLALMSLPVINNLIIMIGLH